MPFRSELRLTEPAQIEVVQDGVRFTLISGERKIRISSSRHNARNFAAVIIAALNHADREQSAKMQAYRDAWDGAVPDDTEV